MMKQRRTIEREHGETYSRSTFAVYEHGTYPRHSVLAGQPRRQWLDGGFATVAEARAKHPDAKVIPGTTHVSVDVMTAGLSDEGDR